MCHSGRPIQAGPAAHVVVSVPPTEPAPAARDAQGVCPPLEAAASVLASATSRTGDEPHTATFVRRAAASRDTMLHDWGVTGHPEGLPSAALYRPEITAIRPRWATAARSRRFNGHFAASCPLYPAKQTILRARDKVRLW